MADSIVNLSDLGHSSNTLEEGKATTEDGGHRSITTAKSPKIWPQRHQSKIFFPTWDIIFVVSSAFSLFVDPLICYIPFVVEKDTCFLWDLQLMWTFLALRSIGDLFYYMDIVVFLKRFHTEHNANSSTWASANTNDDGLVTTVRNFIHKKPVRFLAILGRIWVALPFLQALLLIGRYTYLDNYKFVSLIPFQYILRAYNHYKWLDRRANIETVPRRFLKAILDFLPFVIASHLYGSLWYFLAVDREIICWQDYFCKHGQICDDYIYSFYCGPTSQTYNGRIDIPHLKLSCSVEVELPNNRTSKYGIYLSALQSNMSTSTYLPRKMLQCFWWGLRNLSSFGSNLDPSFDTAQIVFSDVISISGVILFLVYLNSRVQWYQKAAERRILRNKKEKTYPVLIEQTLIVPRHCVNSLKKVPIIGSIDEKGLKAISERLKPVIYNEDVYIIREGEPLRKMLFIWRGITLTYTTKGGVFCSFFHTSSMAPLPRKKAKRSTGRDKWSVLQLLPSIHVVWHRHHSKELRDQLAGTNMYFELVSLLFCVCFELVLHALVPLYIALISFGFGFPSISWCVLRFGFCGMKSV